MNNPSSSKLVIGYKLDIKDVVNKWWEAEIIGKRENHIKVHYKNWSEKWDEWINISPVCDCKKSKKKCTHSLAIKNKYSSSDKSLDQEEKYQTEKKKEQDLLCFIEDTLEKVTFNVYRPSINIGIIGEVSVGKTKLMNALFVQKYGNTAKKKTTMSVNIFKENDTFSKNTMRSLAKRYCETVGKYENNYKKTGDKILNKVIEFDFWVNKIERFSKCKYPINIIDIPGINDAQQIKALTVYLEKKIYLLDVILFMVDIHSSFNTKSELDLLENILKHSQKNNTRILFLFNKYDEEDEELEECFEDGIKIIEKIATKYNVTHENLWFCKFSAELTYIYRMISNGKLDDLDRQDLLKLGKEEFGKKARKMKDNDLKLNLKKVTKKMSDKECEEEMIGFNELRTQINSLIRDDPIELIYNKILNIFTYVSKSEIEECHINYVREVYLKFPLLRNKSEQIKNINIYACIIMDYYIMKNKGKKIHDYNELINKYFTFFKLFPVILDLMRQVFIDKSKVEINSYGIICWSDCLTGETQGLYFDEIREILLNTKLNTKTTYLTDTRFINNKEKFKKLILLLKKFKLTTEKIIPGVIETQFKSLCDKNVITNYDKTCDEVISTIKQYLPKKTFTSLVVSFYTYVSKKITSYDLETADKLAEQAIKHKNGLKVIQYLIQILKKNDAESLYLYLFLHDMMDDDLMSKQYFQFMQLLKHTHFPFLEQSKIFAFFKSCDYKQGQYKKKYTSIARFFCGDFEGYSVCSIWKHL